MLRKSETSQASRTAAEPVIDTLVAAINARDLNAFLACFTESAEVWDLGESKPLLRGKKVLRSAYAKIFANKPNQRLTVLSRIAHQGTVIQKERVEDAGATKESVVIYKAADGRITRIWLGDDA